MNDPAAVHHLSNWSGWNWLLGLGGTTALFAIAVGALVLFTGWSQSYTYDISPQEGISGSCVVVATVLEVIVHSTVARHIAGSAADRWWLFLPVVFAVALAALGYSAPRSRRWVGYAAAGITFVGGVFAAINDALNRVAANIPISVKGLVTVIIFGGIVFVAWMASQNQRSYR